VGMILRDGRFSSNHSPGNVATVKTKNKSARLAKANPATLMRRSSCHHLRRITPPSAIEGHNLHSSRTSRRMAMRCQ
jgi:hypothetical protein